MTEPAGLSTGRFWRGFVITLRPYLMFLSLAAGLAGLALLLTGISGFCVTCKLLGISTAKRRAANKMPEW